MTLKVRGDIRLDFDEKVQVKYTKVEGVPNASLGIQPADALRSGQAAFVPGMAVVPYRGDGKYVAPRTPKPGSPEAASTEPKTSVTFYWWPTGDMETEPLEFTQHAENCVVEVDKDGTVVKAECPKMVERLGVKTISLEFDWKAPKLKPTGITVPPDPATSTTEPSTSTTSSSTPTP